MLYLSRRYWNRSEEEVGEDEDCAGDEKDLLRREAVDVLFKRKVSRRRIVLARIGMCEAFALPQSTFGCVGCGGRSGHTVKESTETLNLRTRLSKVGVGVGVRGWGGHRYRSRRGMELDRRRRPRWGVDGDSGRHVMMVVRAVVEGR